MIDFKTVKANRKAFRPSTIMLIAANLLPLVGVLFWGWSTFNVVVVYWLENLIVGAVNILKMLACSPDPSQVNLSKTVRSVRRNRGSLSPAEEERLDQAERLLGDHGGKLSLANHASKLFLIPFFTVHYGMFCLIHGVFVFVLLGGKDGGAGFMRGGPPGLGNASDMIGKALAAGGVWAVLALAASHLFSFFVNFIGKGEYRRTAVPILMFAPYGRIVVLHVAILFGAFAIVLLGSPIFLLVLLIAGKTTLDLGLHIWSHARLAMKEANTQPPAD